MTYLFVGCDEKAIKQIQHESIGQFIDQHRCVRKHARWEFVRGRSGSGVRRDEGPCGWSSGIEGRVGTAHSESVTGDGLCQRNHADAVTVTQVHP